MARPPSPRGLLVGLLSLLGAPLTASDDDVEMLSASAALPAGAAISASATRQWPDHPGDRAPAVSEVAASAQANLLVNASTSVVVSLGGYDLHLDSQPSASPGLPLPHDLSYGEFEVLPRYFSPQGWCLGADIDLVYNHPNGEFSWDHTDGSVVLFLHTEVKARSSWIYELVYTYQTLYHLPALLPGIAYCISSPTLKACIGLPFSSIDWTPNRHWEISGQIANASTVSLAHLDGIWQEALSWTWNSHLLRYPGPTRGDFLMYEEISCDASLQASGAWGNASVGIGRVLSRTFSDESRDTTEHWGPAWQCTVQGEIDF